MKRHALVTGAAGFLGRHIAKALALDGYEVIGFGRRPWSASGYAQYGISQWYTCEISLENLTEFASGVSVIFHAAGRGSVSLSLINPSEDYISNVETTQKILEFARRNGNTRVVFLSSAAVYGACDYSAIRVYEKYNPISPYGVNKAIGEMLCSQYGKFFGVPIAIVRLFSVYGEGLQKQLLWDASNKLMRGDSNFAGLGSETRDWIHVDDAARLLIAAGRVASNTVPTMNGASGTGTSIREVLEELATSLGVHRPLSFSGDIREGDPPHYQADITEALSTGWRPNISLSEGLRRYSNWFHEIRDTLSR